jgi:hypothetical protein
MTAGAYESMSARPRVIQALLALVVGVALVTGCSNGSSGQPAVPTTVADCGKGIYFGGPDGGVMAGLDWPRGHWALRTPAQAYICLDNYSGSTVRILQSGAQLTIEPAEQTAPPGGGVMPVSITATASGKTELTLQVISPYSGQQQVRRLIVAVMADRAHWHFQKVDD